MKFAQTIASAAIFGFALLIATHASAQSDQSSVSKHGYATIVRIEGHGRYSKGDNTWYPLTVGQTLGPGEIIQSAVDSKIDIVLGDKIPNHLVSSPDKVGLAPDADVRGMVSYNAVAQQNVIRMEGDTVLAIDKLLVANTGVDAITDTELDLRQGTIFGCVKKLSASSQYLIKIPNGIAGVRGTTFILSADGEISVITGSVVISMVHDGHTITKVVNAGEQFNFHTGQVSQLTPQTFTEDLKTAIYIVTLEKGVISFANDQTIIYISPVQGNPTTSHPTWPF